MDISEIRKQRQAIINKYGEWTAHSIELAKNLFTIKGKETPDGRPAHYVKVAQDLIPRSLNHLRVLDLGSLEGMYSLEFAKHGSEVIGIEGRVENIEKAKFVNEVFGFENCRFVQDDVRNLNAEKYGTFDVVLCCGILYHLDAPDVFMFLERIAEVCKRLLIVDTQIAVEETKKWGGKKLVAYEYLGEKFSGCYFKEQLESPWGALNNANSFWLDRKSLYRAIRRVGFLQIYDDLEPHIWTNNEDRVTFVCLK